MHHVRKFVNKIKNLLNKLGVPASPNDLKLHQLKNRHIGKRCFIIGTGPSLESKDLDHIRASNCYSIGSNKIFKIFEQTAWRPNYYAIEDMGIAKAEQNEINNQIRCPIFAAKYLKETFNTMSDVIYFNLINRVAPPILPDFSLNLLHGINCGGTITYSSIQIAAFLGFSEIYLLGVDFNYSLNGLRPSDTYKGLNTYNPNNESNYFAKDYIKPGEVILAPDLESSYCAYQKAQQMVEAGKIPPIYNATRGGKLEVFPRVDFDSLF
jgi:hypothetical protein